MDRLGPYHEQPNVKIVDQLEVTELWEKRIGSSRYIIY